MDGERCAGKEASELKVKTLGIYARIVGYYSKVENWNVGKKQEWKDRKLPLLTTPVAKAA